MGKGPRHGGGGNNDGPNDGPNDDLTELQEKHNEIDELGNEFIDKMEEILAVRKEIESLGDDSASKEFLLNRINELEENTKNQYTREVSEKQEELQEKMTEIQKNHEKQADDNKKIAEKLENISSDKIDLSEVADQTFTDSGLSEGTMDMFVHRFSCIGKGKTIYKEYNKEKKEAGEMILERTLDTVFVNDYIDGIVSRINKLLPAYIETENLISTQIISSAASDHIKNPLNSFDTCDICKEAIHLYVGYAEDNEDSELVLNGSLLVVSNEKISETGRPGGISILTYVLLSIIQNRFANGEIVDNIISMVAIEAEDKYIKQIDRVRKVFPQYIQGVYACTGDDDDMYR